MTRAWHDSVRNGSIDQLQRLLAERADIDVTAAGANPELRGTGAPGFAARTALDLAVARGTQQLIDCLRAG